ncbi:MAG: hypothetical protein IJ237_08690 [Oscillospiraceae bacterium]|nr:hypothetical protein [Oscillospiraceae bacterium]
MKKKSIFQSLFAVLLVLAFALSGLTAFADSPSVQQADSQLNTIFATLPTLKQAANGDVWRYAVTDLNHNGCLEVIAASLHASNASNVKIWELNADASAFQELKVNVPDGESFPDLIADTADTYHDVAGNTWAYIFHDKIALSEQNVYTVICAVTLKDSVLSFNQLAIEHAEVVNGIMNTSYTDNNGFPVSADAYNAAGVNAFAATERSNTAFGWFRLEDITEVASLANSYAVFTGEKELERSTPRPTSTLPSVAPAPSAPAAAPVQQQSAPAANNTRPAYLSVTKNPTNENRKQGDRALFVANANAYDSLTWTFVSPNGGEYSVETFQSYFGSSVTGNYSTTLAVNNVKADMNGWGAYCTFYYNGQTARTSTAYLYVTNAKTSSNASNVYGSISGTVYDTWSNVYLIYLANGSSVQVSRSRCNVVYGDLADGCSCTVYYVAYSNGSYDIYQVDIYGNKSAGYVDPYYYAIDGYDPSAYSYDYYNDNPGNTIFNSDGSSETFWADGSYTGITSEGYMIDADPYGFYDIYDQSGNVVASGFNEDFISNG